jgi:hypothetical protein
MWKSFYAGSELLELPLLSMFLFAFSFGAALWLARSIPADDPRASLPLEKDPQP